MIIILTWLRRRNLKKKTESIIIVAQNIAIKTGTKENFIICQRIASVSYAVTEIKQLIT